MSGDDPKSVMDEIDATIAEVGQEFNLPLSPIQVEALLGALEMFSPVSNAAISIRTILAVGRCHNALVALRSLSLPPERQR